MASRTKSLKKHTQSRNALRRFFRNPTAVLGLVLFAGMVLAVLSASVFFNYEKDALLLNVPERLQGPGAAHWLGTDDKGRDIFVRILFGGRYTLWISFAATLFAVLLGGLLGAMAGYVGGKVDTVVMSIMDVTMCLPSILLAIAIVVALGNSITNLILAIGISNVPKFARIVRSSVMSVRNTEYVQAAQILGTPAHRIIVHHILRNCLGPVIVQATLIFASSILSVSSLSFLGLGIQSPTPEWGTMLSEGRARMREYPYLVVAPGLAIFISIFSLNLLGDGLRDALDPRMDV
jgi:peptide/nickel transport system permease protein